MLLRTEHSLLKKIAFWSFAIICAQAFILSAAFAQSSSQIAAATSRRVKGRTLVSSSLPPLRIKFDKAFKYVGSQKFILYERAQVEQYFFVDADKQKRIRRMFM